MDRKKEGREERREGGRKDSRLVRQSMDRKMVLIPWWYIVIKSLIVIFVEFRNEERES